MRNPNNGMMMRTMSLGYLRSGMGIDVVSRPHQLLMGLGVNEKYL